MCNARIEGEFPGMRGFGSTVRNNHLGKRESIDDRPDLAIIIICDRGKRNAFPMCESCRSTGDVKRVQLCKPRRYSPMCIFQFCHSKTCPSILKLTPSGWTTWRGLISVLG